MLSALVISCEHASNAIPANLMPLFCSADTVLASHRAWDPGALDAAHAWALRWQAPCFSTAASRLVCDTNRRVQSASLWSEFTRDLPTLQKNDILAHYYRPHRDAIRTAIDRLIAAGKNVLHLAVHSFTPIFHGETRTMDLGLLYDPTRPNERHLAKLWQKQMTLTSPDLRVRRNAPYRGEADGLPSSLRKQYRADRYMGFEIEFNQGLLRHGPFPSDAVAVALEQAAKMLSYDMAK